MSFQSKCTLLVLGLLIAGSAGLMAQTTIYVPDPNPQIPGGTSYNVFPWGNSTAFTYAARIPASSMDPNNTRVDDISFAPGLSYAGGTWNAANALIALGHIPSTPPCPFTYPGPGGSPIGDFLDLTIVYDTSIHPPLNWVWTPGAWSPMGLPTIGAQPFVWNGIDDVGFYVTLQSPTITAGFFRAPTGPPWRWYSSGVYQATTTSSCNSTSALVMALDCSPNGNILAVSQTGPGVGDLNIGLSMISGTAYEGWTLLSGNTSAQKGSGPFVGLVPDATTWTFLGIPYFVGNPIHFKTIDVGFFPTVPFYAGPGQVTVLTGLTFDFSVMLLNPLGQYDSRSNVERLTFQ